mmetsp:Transcript_17810/g.53377  ORF Transcript_17810/g.53377 Transcript_17810/m.53377 type:complete len:218 (-) Transcript_17810:85-738(-)
MPTHQAGDALLHLAGGSANAVVAKPNSSRGLDIRQQYHSLACCWFCFVHVNGREHILQQNGSHLHVFCAAKVVKDDQRCSLERMLWHARPRLAGGHVAHERIRLDPHGQRRPARRLRYLQVRGRLGGCQNHEVTHSKRPGNGHEIGQRVALGLLQIQRRVRQHHLAQVLLQVRHDESMAAASENECAWLAFLCWGVLRLHAMSPLLPPPRLRHRGFP